MKAQRPITIVVKIGTSLLAGPEGFDGRVVEQVVRQVAALKSERKLNVLIVSSGAIGCGMEALALRERPRALPLKQATAAVGQSRLMHYYETYFRKHGKGLKTAQVLLSAHDLDNRESYLNVRNTLQVLFDLGSVVPIVNENDSVATEELRFGDNDTLAAKVAAKMNADVLVILSDVDGLYDKDPAQHSDARLLTRVEAVTEEIETLAGDARTEKSVGGMKTKLAAAKIACAAGLRMVIANGRRPDVIGKALEGQGQFTVFGFSANSISHRKRWIAFGRSSRGTIQVDEGACRALIQQGKSLLPAGITSVQGEFEIGAAVKVLDDRGRHIATGLANYSSGDLQQIKGCKSKEIAGILGHKDFDEVIHRDNLVLLK
ncbi:MAG: glutamate 5-kinase [Candidatus Hydrogenedentes bacterium]|nr:glutamate 5-kinase [Candidatus Hydrogenedentota bacterium]